ncbi:hypothetical protein JL721_7537 [Aureococcus anophagefferens]|nr:hypothetical protein JL721_7537 [Aureococcus anophagefferens]
MSAGEKRKRDAAPVVTVKRRGKACSSRFFGVRWHDRDGKWRAMYTDEKGKLIHIAYFDDEEAAARAYNAKIADLGLNRRTNLELLGVLVEKPASSSEFHGVNWHIQREKWQVRVYRSKRTLRAVARVEFEGHEEEAAALGLETRPWPRVWDTLVGDDSKFVSCTLAPNEKKKKRAPA